VAKVIFEFDAYEESTDVKRFINSGDMYSNADEAYYIARNRLKYGENVSDEEERVLEQIKELLYLDE